MFHDLFCDDNQDPDFHERDAEIDAICDEYLEK